MRFLFWNLNGRELGRVVSTAAAEHNVDIVLLAESAATSSQLASDELAPAFAYSVASSDASKVAVYTRLPRDTIVPFRDISGMTFLRICPESEQEFMLVGVHLPSKLHVRDFDQMSLAQRCAVRIEEVEDELNHQRTIVVGDFNMNPFDAGLVSGLGLHAAMTRSRALKGSRKVQGELSRRFLYNPMWSHFGERPSAPPGTYHYQSNSPVCYFWNIFDQVLVRPDLLPTFEDESVRILAKVGRKSLLTRGGIPSRKVGSDHLPLLFDLHVSQTERQK